MSSYPTAEGCLVLLKKCGCSKEVIKHCLAVRDVAVKIAKKANADVELVEVGALLHDIGRSITHDTPHVIKGGKIAKKLDLPKEVVRIIERHIGAGLSKEEAKKLGLPEKNYIPKTLEEKIVCHADSLIENSKKQKIEKEVKRALKNDQKEYAYRLLALHKELSDICGIDIDEL